MFVRRPLTMLFGTSGLYHRAKLTETRFHPPGRGPADDCVIRTHAPTIQAMQTRRINCDHSWKSEISDKKLVPIYIVYF